MPSTAGWNEATMKAMLRGRRQVFVYQFGRGFGFCADYIWLLTCLVKCLEFGHGFRLGKLRRASGFATEQGWADYFVPFFEEADGPLLQPLNRPQLPYARRLPFLKPVARRWLAATVRPRAQLFMLDDLGELASIRNPRLPSDDFPTLCRELLRLLWVYNPRTEREVAACLGGMRLPADYAAVHIRRGDKNTEHAYVPVDAYVAAIRAAGLAPGSAVFAASDDRAAIAELAAKLDGHPVVAPPVTDTGYDQNEFNALPAAERRARTIRFLAELEAMRRATVFFGSSTTNVASFVGFHRGLRDVCWV